MLLVSSCSCLYPIRWSQVLSWEWRCSWSSADRRCSNYIWVINNLIACKCASYIRDLTVSLLGPTMYMQYIPKNMHMVCYLFSLLWFGTDQFFPYSSGSIHRHWGNHMIASMLEAILDDTSFYYYPLFRVRSWNNGMCCMSFYIFMNDNENITNWIYL